MLDVEPSKRPSAANILTHPWMTSANPPNTQLVVTREAHYIKVTFINRLIVDTATLTERPIGHISKTKHLWPLVDSAKMIKATNCFADDNRVRDKKGPILDTVDRKEHQLLFKKWRKSKFNFVWCFQNLICYDVRSLKFNFDVLSSDAKISI